MKMCSLITNLDELISLKDKIDAVCILTNYSESNIKISDEEVIFLINKANELNKKVILKLDIIPNDSNIKEIISFLDMISLKDISLLISDLGLFYLLKDKYEIIYANSVLVTNKENFAFYINNGFSHAIPSLEITFEDVLSFDKQHIFFKAFGYHQMMQSKRMLINTYHDFLNISKDNDDYDGYLVEEVRNEKYKIYQTNRGTVIFRQHPLNYYSKYEELKNFDYIYFDSHFINFEIFEKVISIYYDLFNNLINLDEATSKFNDLNIKYENTFINTSTIYLKENMK